MTRLLLLQPVSYQEHELPESKFKPGGLNDTSDSRMSNDNYWNQQQQQPYGQQQQQPWPYGQQQQRASYAQQPQPPWNNAYGPPPGTPGYPQPPPSPYVAPYYMPGESWVPGESVGPYFMSVRGSARGGNIVPVCVRLACTHLSWPYSHKTRIAHNAPSPPPCRPRRDPCWCGPHDGLHPHPLPPSLLSLQAPLLVRPPG